METMINREITYEDFLLKVIKYHASSKDWRYGQTYFNTLSSFRSDIAEMIRGTLHDPFHKKEVSLETENFVRSKW